MMLFRFVYLVSVLVGLGINIGEYLHARWVYQELWRRQINGVRQMIAQTFVSEERMRVLVQCCLLVASLVAFGVSGQIETPRHLRGWVFLSICAHEAVALMLMVKALKHRRARRSILRLATAVSGPELGSTQGVQP